MSGTVAILADAFLALRLAAAALAISVLVFGVIALVVKGREAVEAGIRAIAEVRMNVAFYFFDALFVAPVLSVMIAGLRYAMAEYSLAIVSEDFWAAASKPVAFVAVLFIGGQWATPAIQSPQLALVADIAVTGVLLGLAVWATIRSAGSAAHQPLAFAAWTVLLPVMNPQSLGHNGVLLAVPLVLTLRWVLQQPGWRHRLLWSSALLLVSVPRQTTWRLAPPPVDPWQGLGIVALPLWGALLLFGGKRHQA